MSGLTRITTNGGVPFTVDADQADKFTGLLNDLEASGYPIKSNESGGYNYRTIAGTNTLSRHATGDAIDVNWGDNARGTNGNIDPTLARTLASKYGMTWGGDWSNPDPMHFELGHPAASSTTQTNGAQNGAISGGQPRPMSFPAPMALGGQKPMPTDPMTGAYVPDDVISHQYSLANALMGAQPRGVGLWSNIAGGLNALGANVYAGSANQALAGNQAIHSAGLRAAAGATDIPSLSRTLLGSSDPTLQDYGLKTQIHAIENDPMQEYKNRAAAAKQYGFAEDSPEYRALVLTGKLPDPNAGIDNEYKRAQIEKLRKPDPVEDMVAGMLKGQGTTAAPVTTPAVPAVPPALPQNYEGPSPSSNDNPLLLKVADTRAVPAGAPTPAPVRPQAAPEEAAAPASPTDIIDTPFGKMSRADAIRKGGALTLSPKYAAAGKALLDAAQTGGPGIGLGKNADNQNDKEEIQATNQLGTLDSIVKSYDPKFLNVGNRLKYWSNEWKAKFGLLKPEDQTELQDYAAFRQSSWHNLNRVLKDLSGTAVTENEMQRQLLDQPNPGQGIGDGDSPPSFEAKLKGEIGFAKNAVARARYLRNKGFTGKPWEAGLAVEDMPAIINQRGAQIEQEIKQANPNADPMQLQQAVTSRVKQEFGI